MKVSSCTIEGPSSPDDDIVIKNMGQIGRLTMKTSRKNLIHSRMKQLEKMSMEELIQEANYLAKRIEEIETADKEEKLRISELEKQVELFEKAQKSISNGESETGKGNPTCRNCLI